MLAFDSPAMLNETFVVADPEAMSIAEIFACLRAAAGRSAGLFPVPPGLIAGLLGLAGRTSLWDRMGRDLVVDPGKLLAAGWKPSVTTREGFCAMVDKSRV
jgi:UDP-glucose 4-epimerase